MKPFAEWTHNEDAVDLDLARRLVAERWPDAEAKVIDLGMSYEIGVRFGAGRAYRATLLEMAEKPPLYPAVWRAPGDWSEPALRAALDDIERQASV